MRYQLSQSVTLKVWNATYSYQQNSEEHDNWKRLNNWKWLKPTLINSFLVAFDKRHFVMLLLLDLSAAFDTVDHDILHTRLHSKYSISGTALEWFLSYLNNRSQFGLIEGCRSQSRELEWGVPQGSVLGPILHALYTATLADILRFHEMQFHLHADDTQLNISFPTNSDMELTNSITKIEEWLSDTDKWMSINRLNLNKDKTELLYLFSKYTVNFRKQAPGLIFFKGPFRGPYFWRDLHSKALIYGREICVSKSLGLAL